VADSDAGRAVLSDLRNSVLTLTLNRPQRRNAMDAGAWEQLFQELRAASIDDEVRCVVLTGADHTFCAGADITTVPAGHPLVRIRHISRVAELLYHLPKPVIAQVEGHAVGAGWNLALCCDLVVAASTAQFRQIFVSRGLSPDFGGSWLLPRLAGLQNAKRLTLLAERISAAEAHGLGLVTWVVDPQDIDPFVRDLASRLAAMPPIAAAQTKELLNSGAAGTFREALDNESRAQAVNYATEDAPRAIRAFKDHEDITFTGNWGVR
jgi:2-(1,2-epoxy-1,2-dihydrophenyl)acetyl-CoA isomerase